MPSEKPFLTFVVEPELLERIDEFRFARRFSSRAEAIRWLLRWALDHQATQTLSANDQGKSSAATPTPSVDP